MVAFMSHVSQSVKANEKEAESLLCLINSNYPHGPRDTHMLPVSHVKQIPSMEVGPK